MPKAPLFAVVLVECTMEYRLIDDVDDEETEFGRLQG